MTLINILFNLPLSTLELFLVKSDSSKSLTEFKEIHLHLNRLQVLKICVGF